MRLKAELMDEQALSRAMIRISHEIIEKNKGINNVALIGIKRRGVPLAHRLAENISKIENGSPDVGELDIKLYRDDLTEIAKSPEVNDSKIDFDVTGKDIVLVDDVLFTGRTVRAAIEAIFALGRPSSIQLAILIDRGPFRPDFVGKNVPTSLNEIISVQVPEYDGKTSVELYQL